MMDVTNTFYEPGAFATLLAHEWTNMSCGHRNLYFRADKAAIFRSDDKRYDTPDKLWRAWRTGSCRDPASCLQRPDGGEMVAGMERDIRTP